MKTVNELEKKGIELAQWCDWNGVNVLEVAQAALTNANFHAEAEVIEKMVKALNTIDNEVNYTLAIEEKE